MKRRIVFALLLLSSLTGFAQKPVFVSIEAEKWADSVLLQMPYEQKIGQLFMVDAFSNKDSLHIAQVTQLIDSFNIGGLIFFQGGPARQLSLTNFYQSRSVTPLLIGIDGEWGLSMRLDSTMRFPRQMTLGAGAKPEQVYQMGVEIGRQCKRMGIHINFAPDADVNNNPANPIINSRSFGEDKNAVADLAVQYMRGMQDAGVLACAKHFPGHGDTDTDSHLSLPVVHASAERMDSIELYPFRKLIQQGLGSVMVAHLFVPALDSTLGLASTLSLRVVDSLLKKQMNFGGLVFTDALNMKGVANDYPSGELELRALKAGNDVLLYSLDVGKAVARIHSAIQECEIEQSLIDEKVRKILMAKYWAGLKTKQNVSIVHLPEDLNSAPATWLNFQMYAAAPTLLRNKNSVVPLNPYYRDCVASVVVNDTTNNYFQQMLANYGHVDFFRLPKDASKQYADSLLKVLSDYDRIIVSVHNTTINAAKNFGVTAAMSDFAVRAGKLRGSILSVFGNAYVLGKFEGYESFDAVVQGYEDTYLPQWQVAQKIFGADNFYGRLPVSSPPYFYLNEGLVSKKNGAVAYTLPEAVGADPIRLAQIDSLVNVAIADSVFPGCQVLVMKDAQVIYNKAFGWHTYAKEQKVVLNDVYDVASVTKIASTALAAMYLFDRHKIDPEAKVSKYLHFLRSTDKKDITIREIMAHQSGLKAWIPFWKNTVDSTGQLDTMLYKSSEQSGYHLKVADKLYLKDSYKEQLLDEVAKSPLEKQGQFVYSDLGIILLQQVIEKVSGKSIDQLVTDVFYKPLGLWQMGYHPLAWKNADNIVPTEIDTAFRKQLVQGYVHDPAAAMMGGVGGHAGVFSNAQSLAVIMQMLLNKGSYAGKQYLKPATVELFTSKAYPESNNRRGLVFDKPDLSKGVEGPSAMSASLASFGHSGFTGTYVWADPSNNLVYIFLSNRVYPDAHNNKLAKSNLRTRIQQIAYESMKQ